MFESQDPDRDVMNRKPRSLKDRLFSKRDLIRSALQGSVVFATSALAFAWTYIESRDPDRVRAVAFVTLVLSNIGLIVADLGSGSLLQLTSVFAKRLNLLILGGSVAILVVGFSFAPLRILFMFKPLSVIEIVVAIGIACGTFAIVAFWNWIAQSQRRRQTARSWEGRNPL